MHYSVPSIGGSREKGGKRRTSFQSSDVKKKKKRGIFSLSTFISRGRISILKRERGEENSVRCRRRKERKGESFHSISYH